MRSPKKLPKKFEVPLRKAARDLWDITLPEYRPNILARFEQGKLTHLRWSDLNTGCTCLVGSVQPLDGPLLSMDERIADTYTTLNTRFDRALGKYENYEDYLRLSGISDGWEGYVAELLDRCLRDEEEPSPDEWAQIYDVPRRIVLEELMTHALLEEGPVQE